MIRGLTKDMAQATHKDGKDVGIELVRPPAGSKPGDRIYFEGPDFESEYCALCLERKLRDCRRDTAISTQS